MNDGTNAHRRCLVRSLAAVGALVLAFLPATSAFAHEGEENVPAITDVEEAIAILAEHPGLFSPEEVTDHAMDKVGDALESNDARGVSLDLVSPGERRPGRRQDG